MLKNNINKLSGIKDNYYRLRVGRYRVIFKKEEKRFIIVIVRIGHRKQRCLYDSHKKSKYDECGKDESTGYVV